MVKPRDGAGEFLGEEDAAGGAEVELHSDLSPPRVGGGVRGGGDDQRSAPAPARPDRTRASPSPLQGEGRVGRVQIRQPFGELQRGLEAVGEARLDAFADDDAVDDDLDVVLVFLVERGGVLDGVEFAVDADALEARLLPLGELLPVLALAAADDGGEEVVAAAFGQRHHAVDHLADLLRLDRKAGGGRIGNADARPEQAHIIVDFGDGGDGRARVAAGGLLLDRDGGREAVDMLDVRLLHHLEELARVGGQTLDVAALAFGVDGVEGEARLARAAEAGDDRQALARDVDVDALEIMFARAATMEIRKCE